MAFNIPKNLTLTGDIVTLEPMRLEHEADLNNSVNDGELYNLRCTSIPKADGMSALIKEALSEKEKGDQIPFVVRRLSDNQIIGSTRYYLIRPKHNNLSIGFTWYAKSAQRTAVNTECKLLLLTYAFDELNCISVALHVDDTNLVSQAAVERLGAKHEGILRNDRIMPNGRIRHTHCYSVIDSEWPEIKTRLAGYLSS